MNRLALAAALVAGLAGCWVPDVAEPDPGEMARYPLRLVKQVLSGDTILLDDGGEGSRVHYARVKAPPAGSALWSEAKALNARLVEGQEVRIIPVEHDGEDTYGFVFVPNASRSISLLVQFELARAGLVRPADLPDDSEDRYFERIMLRAEAARREGLGIWAAERAAGR